MFKLAGCIVTLWILHAIGLDAMLTWIDRTNAVLAAQLRAYQDRTRDPNARRIDAEPYAEPVKRRRRPEQPKTERVPAESELETL